MNLIRPLVPIISLAILPAVILYIVVLYLSSAAGIDPILVLRDPIQACDYPTAVGMISNLGVLMWCSATVVNLFPSISGLVIHKKWRQLLYLGGFFSGVLCIDDLFLLHDRHVGEYFIYCTYSFLALLLILRFYKLILRSDPIAFLLSIFFLGLSVVVDSLHGHLLISYQTTQLYEEGFKFVGIACWLFFWWKASFRALKQIPE